MIYIDIDIDISISLCFAECLQLLIFTRSNMSFSVIKQNINVVFAILSTETKFGYALLPYLNMCLPYGFQSDILIFHVQINAVMLFC